jgi:hypothetical protein
MQCFLPYEDFTQSARVIDYRRLGKQRSETLQILNALSNPDYGWQNHPAVTMWRGYELSLVSYGTTICDEWIRRGYNDTCRGKILKFAWVFPSCDLPWWLGDPRLHISHQSNLLRKAPWAYAHLWPTVPRNLEYWWPSGEER